MAVAFGENYPDGPTTTGVVPYPLLEPETEWKESELFEEVSGHLVALTTAVGADIIKLKATPSPPTDFKFEKQFGSGELKVAGFGRMPFDRIMEVIRNALKGNESTTVALTANVCDGIDLDISVSMGFFLAEYKFSLERRPLLRSDKLSAELRTAKDETAALRIELSQVTTALRLAKTDGDAAKQQLDETRDKLAAAATEIEKVTTQAVAECKELRTANDELAAAKQRSDARVVQLSKESASLKAQLGKTKVEMAKAASDSRVTIKELRGASAKTSTECHIAEQRMAALKEDSDSRIAQLSKEFAAKESQMSDAISAAKKRSDGRVMKMSMKVTTLKAQLDGSRVTIEELRGANDTAFAKCRSVEQKLARINSKYSHLIDAKKHSDARITELMKQIASLKTQLGKAKVEMAKAASISRVIIKEMGEANAKASAECHTAEQRTAALRKHSEVCIAQLSKEIEAKSHMFDALSATKKRSDGRIVEMSKEITSLKAQLGGSRVTIEELRVANEKASAKCSSVEEKLVRLTSKCSHSIDAKKRSDTRIMELMKEMASLKTQLTKTKAEMAKAASYSRFTIKELRGAIVKASADCRDVEQRTAAAKQKSDERIVELSKEIASLKSQLGKAETSIDELKAASDSCMFDELFEAHPKVIAHCRSLEQRLAKAKANAAAERRAVNDLRIELRIRGARIRELQKADSRAKSVATAVAKDSSTLFPSKPPLPFRSLHKDKVSAAAKRTVVAKIRSIFTFDTENESSVGNWKVSSDRKSVAAKKNKIEILMKPAVRGDTQMTLVFEKITGFVAVGIVDDSGKGLKNWQCQFGSDGDVRVDDTVVAKKQTFGGWLSGDRLFVSVKLSNGTMSIEAPNGEYITKWKPHSRSLWFAVISQNQGTSVRID